MNLLKEYIQNFISRAGSYILISSVVARVLSFFASWVALQFVSNKELGVVLFAYNIVVFIMPISGLGLHQSLIRYGSLLKTIEEKNSLFRFTFYKGVKVTILLILVLISLSFLINFKFENTNYYLAFLALTLLPMYLFELIKIHFRIHHKNKLFASTEIVFTLFLTLTIFVLSYYFKEKGYALALLLTPIFSVLFYLKKYLPDLKFKTQLDIIGKEFWKYGFFASLSNVVSRLLLIIDILLIGIILNDAEMVTSYKYISLFPLSLLFLPRAFINADFVAFTENIYNKNYITKYIKSYILLFSIISILFILFFSLFSKQILGWFDTEFIQFNNSFLILILGVSGILVLRGLFGNLLSSIGMAKVNFYIAFGALLLNIISNYYMINLYGIKGAAITSAVLMWITGIVSAFVFWQLYNNRFLNKK